MAQTPTLAELIEQVRTSESPLEREYAVRCAYLLGGVDVVGGKANSTFEATRFSQHSDPSVSVTRVQVGAA